MLGRDRDGQPVHLKDVGYLQSGYDLRRGIADLDGTGEVVGGIAIMEQGRNVLAVTNALRAEARAAQADAARGHRAGARPTIARRSIWDTLTNFFQAIVYELIVVILVIGVALRNVRASVAPVVRPAARHAVHRAAARAVRPDRQSVLARRPGHRHRRDGRRDHRHRRELHDRAGSSGRACRRREDGGPSSTRRRR